MHRTITASALVLASTAGALAGIDHFAPADALNGGTILVDFQIFDPATGLCVPGQREVITLDGTRTPNGVPSAVAGSASFLFEVIGVHTYFADWTIRNTSANPFIYIKRVTFDLSTSTMPTFFDDDKPSPFDTVGSFAGIDDIIYNPASTAPMQTSANEFVPWADPCNAGDEFSMTIIEWADCAFAPGQLFIYNDDTDVIPVPGVASLAAAAGLLGLRRRRR